MSGFDLETAIKIYLNCTEWGSITTMLTKSVLNSFLEFVKEKGMKIKEPQ